MATIPLYLTTVLQVTTLFMVMSKIIIVIKITMKHQENTIMIPETIVIRKIPTNHISTMIDKIILGIANHAAEEVVITKLSKLSL